MKTKTVCIILLVSSLLLFNGCARTGGGLDTTGNSDTTAGFYTTDEECFSVKTKYGELEYPNKWKDITKTEIVDKEPYAVKFYCVTSAGDIPLFDINFNGGEGFCLGTLSVDGENVPVYLDSFEIDESKLNEEEYFNCCAMEEDVNVIISRLIEKNGLVLSDNNSPAAEQTEEENNAVYPIETKYGNLSYPEKWKDLVKTEISDEEVYTVSFSGKTENGDIPLFDLTFNGGDGYLLGTMKVDGKDVTIYISDYTFDEKSMSEDEYFNCCAMQEDVNVILQHLVEDYGFQFSTNG